MRLEQFDLTRYGKFTNASVSLPAPGPEAPDFHIVYGPNEAGKSTFLNAWLDFLFEFPARSPMNFLHAYSAMRLDAQVCLAGETTRLSRIKKRAGSLLDMADTVVPETVLSSALQGLNRDTYSAMFSLDRQRLNDGGEGILASQGDLGALLFQASAGLTELSAQLRTARADSDTFLSPSGRSGRLRDLHKDLKELDSQIKTLDIAATDYVRLTKDRDTARAAYDTARAETLGLQRALSETERKIAAFPFALRLQQLDEQLAGYSDLPAVKPDWITDLSALDRAETSLTADLQHANDTLAALDKARVQLTPDDAALALTEQIAQAETLKASHDTAQDDLPRRRPELDALAAKIDDRVARLGRPDVPAGDLVPDLATMSGLRALSERHTTLQANLSAAQEEEHNAQTAMQAAEHALTAAQAKPGDTNSLERLLTQLRSLDLVGAQVRLSTDLAALAPELNRAATELGISDPGHVSRLRLPDPALLSQLEQDQASAQATVDRLVVQSEDLCRAHDDLSGRLSAMQAAGTVTPDDVTAARAQREAAWATHKATLTAKSAQDFEDSMRLDDQMTTALAAQQSQAERVAELTASIAQKARSRDQVAEQLATANTALAHTKDRFAALLSGFPVGFSADTDMTALRTWLGRLRAAQDLAARHSALTAQMAHCDAQIDQARQDLGAALCVLGAEPDPSASLRVALETAQTVLDQSRAVHRLQDTARTAQLAHSRRKDAVNRAQAALTKWASDWARTARSTWLAELDPLTTPVRPILEELDQLRSLLEKHADLSRRIASMEENAARFQAAVAQLADALACAPSWAQITERRATARATAKEIADAKTQHRAAVLKRDQLEASARQHRARIEEIARHLGTPDWSSTYAALVRAAKQRDLLSARNQCADDLCSQLRVTDVNAALAQLAQSDEDTLRAEVMETEAAVQQANSTQDSAHSAFLDADRAVQRIGGDGAIARLQEQRQTLLLIIEEEARAHLRQRLGLLSVDQALHAYRNTHRSGMLNRASDAFRAITLGRYERLEAQPDGTREVLAAISDSGASLLADHLSEGTREQLYLALRIAGYHEFVQQKGPVPFIADDIMESFDDDRAGAAFALLGDMARSGQVIYLTHHAHMCDLARAHCPDVQVHDLTG